MLLVCLTLSIEHPRCLVQQEIFQILVLLELRGERDLRIFLFPELKGGLGLRITAENQTTQGVGIERGSLRDGIIVGGCTHRWQCLYHQPSGIVGIFECQFAVGAIGRNELRQVDGLCSSMVLGDGQRNSHTLLGRQNGQIVLFTVGEALATDAHLTNQK